MPNKFRAFADKSVWAHFQAAHKVARILNQHKFDAFLIGGAVRDILMNRLPKDFDIVTNAKPDEILALSEINKAMYKDTAQAFGVSRVRVDVDIRGKTLQSEVEIATYRRDIEAHLGRKNTKVEYSDLAEDVRRRDFTVNALALDLANDSLIDLVGGVTDIDDKIIRFIGEPKDRIKEDPLRILRGIRLKVQLGFNYDPKTQTAIAEAVKNKVIFDIATERLQDELSRMLTHSTRRLAIEELDNFEIIKQVLPELEATKNVAQPRQFHVEGDVWTHSLMAIDNLPTHPTKRLAWATLLHDIGKPPTFTPAEKTGDRIRFSDHYRVGAKMAKKILNRLNFPNKLTDDISWMIEKHIGIDDLPKMRAGRAREFMSHDAFEDLLLLHEADAKASLNSTPDGKVKVPDAEFDKLYKIWDAYKKQKDKKSLSLKGELGVNGEWLKSQLNVSEGPVLGRLLTELNEAYLDGEIKNQRQALELAKSLYKKIN